MQPSNATAVRPTASAPAPGSAAPLNIATNENLTAESLGRQLRGALPPLRMHSVSLFDDQANVLWLSEGALGPDEHTVVLEAIGALRDDTSLQCYESGLGDGRMGVFLPIRAPQGNVVGTAMVLADHKSVNDTVIEKMAAPAIRSIMQKVAVLLRPLPPVGQVADAAVVPAAATLSSAAVDEILEFELAEAPPPAKPKTDVEIPDLGGLSLASTADIPILSPPAEAPSKSRTGTHKALAGTSTAKALAGTGTSQALASTRTAKSSGSAGSSKILAATGSTTTSRTLELPDGVSLRLEVQPYTKLRSGGRTRRFEVIARASHPNRVPAGFDRFALQRLLMWLSSNRSAWGAQPTSFTLNLSVTALEDERFPQFIASNLKTHGIAAENIGFEIAEPLCVQKRGQVERFISLCDKLGCFVVIDDFSLDSTIVPLLRSKALRLVKIDPRLTSIALKDKLSQAMVVAIAQAVKILGIHCAAKQVDSQAAQQWLTAIGCDFAQGSALAPSQPLESLGAPATPGG